MDGREERKEETLVAELFPLPIIGGKSPGPESEDWGTLWFCSNLLAK